MRISPVYLLTITSILVLGASSSTLANVSNDVSRSSKYRQQFVKLKETHTITDPFLDRLKRGYIKLSESEWKQEDKKNSKIYAQKAISIMRGLSVEPMEISNLTLSKGQLAPLEEGRQFLLMSFTNNLKQLFPEAAAQAQLMFDCWVEQEVDGRRPEDITYCKSGFAQVRHDINTFFKNPAAFPKRAALATNAPQAPSTNEPDPLEVEWPFAAPALTVPRDIAATPISPIIPNTTPTENISFKPDAREIPVSYKAFFAKNETQLDLPTQQLLDKVSQDAARYKPDRIQVIAYQGNSSEELTEMRILTVAGYLADKGVSQELLDLRAYKTAPPITKEENGRFCEINFEKKVN